MDEEERGESSKLKVVCRFFALVLVVSGAFLLTLAKEKFFLQIIGLKEEKVC